MGSAEDNGALDTALGRLAAYYGIEPGFRDARGQDIVTSPATQIALLAAMGVDAESESHASAALEGAQALSRESLLPPVIVVRDEGAQRCSVTIAAPADMRPIRWHVTLEDGTQRDGMHVTPALAKASSERLQADVCIELGDLPWGYHQLDLPESGARAALIVTPRKCWLPDSFEENGKLWGLAAQLYLLRSGSNWGIGDFADLTKLICESAERGCDVIGLNPLHQMFLDQPEQASPYSPMTRLYLNVLYIAVPEAPGYDVCPAVHALVASADFQARLTKCRAAHEVDYAEVTSLKLEALRGLHRWFIEDPSEAAQRFEEFRREKGESLRRASIFQALRQYFAEQDPAVADWHKWGREYQDASSGAVQKFAQDHRDEIEFLEWLQWVADEQLAKAARAAADIGMQVGLYRDLAVGCDRSGAETWANPEAFMEKAQVGAPPDIFNPAGQDWGLPPSHPKALREEAYGSFVELIRANMRHAGGLRIDHVMGLQHLYCIPSGCSPDEGAYVGYPLDDLIGILALESQRHRCLVVGEDLGTVPKGFREKMEAACVLSYRVLFFEQDWTSGVFLQPGDYPRLSLAVAGSHDLPTLVGWWEERDIDLKERLGLYPSDEEAQSQRQRRENDRSSLIRAFRREGLLEAEDDISADAFAAAAHDFLALSNAGLVAVQIDDVLGEPEQVNVPGTSREHPNWRRKYSITLEDLTSCPENWSRAGRLAEIRQHQ